MADRAVPRRWPATVTAALAGLVGLVVAVTILLPGRAGGPAGDTAAEAFPLPPSGTAGPLTVEMTADAQAHPEAAAVRALLGSYFGAINTRNYRQWTGAVVADLAARQSPAQWARDYRSTSDGSVRVARIEPAVGDGIRVLLSFISVQAPEDAPPDLRAARICWQASYDLVPERSTLRLDVRRPGSVLRMAC